MTYHLLVIYSSLLPVLYIYKVQIYNLPRLLFFFPQFLDSKDVTTLRCAQGDRRLWNLSSLVDAGLDILSSDPRQHCLVIIRLKMTCWKILALRSILETSHLFLRTTPATTHHPLAQNKSKYQTLPKWQNQATLLSASKHANVVSTRYLHGSPALEQGPMGTSLSRTHNNVNGLQTFSLLCRPVSVLY